MSLFAADLPSYEATIEDPDSGAVHTVTLKRLDGGATAKLLDVAFDDDLGEGSFRLLALQEAIVGWDLPGGPPTPDRVAGLTGDAQQLLFSQLHPGDARPLDTAARVLAAQLTKAASTTQTETPAPADDADGSTS